MKSWLIARSAEASGCGWVGIEGSCSISSSSTSCVSEGGGENRVSQKKVDMRVRRCKWSPRQMSLGRQELSLLDGRKTVRAALTVVPVLWQLGFLLGSSLP